uniref:Titin n=1 Tax=Myripristis murdjan TaxID=586833 RepID=A0A667WSM8_9TELE
ILQTNSIIFYVYHCSKTNPVPWRGQGQGPEAWWKRPIATRGALRGIQAQSCPSENGEVLKTKAGKVAINIIGMQHAVTIQNATDDDAGVYTCEVANQEDCKTSTNVKVIGKPLATSKDEVILDCELSKDVPVLWYHNEMEVTASKMIVMRAEGTRRALVLRKVEDKDKGKYVCDCGTDKTSANLNIEEPPEIQLDVKLLAGLTARAGTKIELPADVKGKPDPRVKWTKADLVLRGDDRITIDTQPGHSKLSIGNTTRGDTATYIIENAAGKKSATVVVLVLSEPGENSRTCTLNIVIILQNTIVLPAKMKGIPAPTAKWMSDGKEIASEGRFKIESDESSTTLSIPECLRGDTGEYILTVSNPAGSKTVALHVTVLDVPGPPIGPINILEVTPDHMIVQWRAPKDDGGTPITNYVVEKKDVKKPWEPWSVVSSGGISTTAKVSRLEKGREYIVRVRAENKIGIGAGLESPPTIAKHMFNPPGPPGLPECSDITENAVTVEWTLPDYDGGSPISGYVIERREMTGKWIRVNKTPVLDLRYRVSGLFEGNTYEFRVFAENIAGISEPSPISDPVKASRAITKPGPPGNPKLKDWSKSYSLM